MGWGAVTLIEEKVFPVACFHVATMSWEETIPLPVPPTSRVCLLSSVVPSHATRSLELHMYLIYLSRVAHR